MSRTTLRLVLVVGVLVTLVGGIVVGVVVSSGGDDGVVSSTTDTDTPDPGLLSPRTIEVGPDGEYRDLAAAVEAAPAGSTIRVAAGIYRVTETLVIDKELSIVGERALSASRADPLTVIRETGSGRALVVRSVPGGVIQDVRFETTVDQTDRTQRLSLVEVRDSTFDVEGVVIEGGDAFGLFYLNSQGGVRNSIFAGSAWGGLLVDGGAPSVFNNLATAHDSSGFQWRNDAGGIAEENEAVTNGRNGFVVRGAATVELGGNCAHGNGRHGFAFYDTSQTIVRSSDATDNGRAGGEYAGFAWFDTAGGTARNNRATGNAFSNQFFLAETATAQLFGVTVSSAGPCLVE